MCNFVSLVHYGSGDVVVPRVEIASNFWRRFRGLQFRAALEPGCGLLLIPCHAIHTHWMRFCIDVALLDRDWSVLELHHNVPPWRMLAGPQATYAVLEVSANWLPGRLAVGDRLSFQTVPD